MKTTSTRIDRTRQKKSWQRLNIIKSAHYDTSPISLKTDDKKNYAAWSEKFRLYRKQDKHLKQSFDSNWSWYQIGTYILKFLRTIKTSL
tara:strand:- start:503 stop:769 length:267 start_codon:yes stop_codon:yes gene_type:complete